MILLMEGAAEGKNLVNGCSGRVPAWSGGTMTVWQFRENSKWYLQDDPFLKYFKEHGKNECIF